MDQNSQAYLGTSIWWAAFLSLFIVPALTMNQFHKKQRTDFFLLLRTLRLNPYILIWLHFLRGALFLLFLNMVLLVQYGFLFHYGDPDHILHISAFIGLFGLQLCYLAAGLLFSAFSDSNLKALFTSCFVFFVSWVLFYADYLFSGSFYELGIVLKEMSIYKHFFRFYMGSVFLHDIFFFLLLIPVLLFLGGMALKK
jgi:hypothetical protein